MQSDNRSWLHEDSYRVFIGVLQCLRCLMGTALRHVPTGWLWRDIVGTAHVPSSVLHDLLANVYNTCCPETLALYQDIDNARPVDVDKLLLLVLDDFKADLCPVSPLLRPRRCQGQCRESRMEVGACQTLAA
eukprot:scaffold266_cov391-Prasinococcus_capsulatus_cf.AAC.5